MTSTLFQPSNRKGAKLNQSQVYDIRKLAKEGATQGFLAKMYHVSVITIGRIVRREVWQDLPERQMTEEELEIAAQASQARFLEMVKQSQQASPAAEIVELKNEMGKKDE